MKRSCTLLIAAAALAACGTSETPETNNAASPEAISNNMVEANDGAPGVSGPAEGNAAGSNPVPPSGSPPTPSGAPPLAAPPPAAPPPPPGEDKGQSPPVLEHEYMNHADHADHPPAKDDPLR